MSVDLDSENYSAVISSKRMGVNLTMQILEVKEGVYCLDFRVKGGDLLGFIGFYQKVR